jgi:hypothetical protein
MHKNFGFLAMNPSKLEKYPPESLGLAQEIKHPGLFFFLSG